MRSGWVLLLIIAACGEPSRAPRTDADPPASAAEGKYYPLPPRLRNAEQRHRARALESIGYATGGDDAPQETGVLVHRRRAHDSPRFFVSGHGPVATLMSVGGQVLHEWRCPAARVFDVGDETKSARYFRRARLLPGGEVLALFTGVGLVHLARDSSVVWSLPGRFHHDIDFTPEGRLWVLENEVGVLPWLNPERPVLVDNLVELTADGEVLRRVSLLECVDASPLSAGVRAQLADNFAARMREEVKVLRKRAAYFAANPEHRARFDLAGDILHSNTLQWLDGALGAPFEHGHLLVCVRNLGRVFVVDPAARAVTWELPGPRRPGMHDPQLLENGNLLLFDNHGTARHDGAAGHSEVIEVDPTSGRVVWSYRASRPREFLSHIAGTCQRLPNGNTLIAQSTGGRAFEVTPAGEIVWDFISPHRAGADRELVAFLPDVFAEAAPWLAR